jgi:hypothetical protein
MSILARIRAHGGEVIRDGHKLTLRRGRLDAAALAWLRDHWRDVAAETWPEFDQWEERAAIREFDAGQTRADAEAAAYRDVMGC